MDPDAFFRTDEVTLFSNVLSQGFQKLKCTVLPLSKTDNMVDLGLNAPFATKKLSTIYIKYIFHLQYILYSSQNADGIIATKNARNIY